MRLIFNLTPFGDQHFLPTAYLAHENAAGALTYLGPRASEAICLSNGVEITPVAAKLLALTEQMTVKALETRFKPTKAKTVTPLAAMLSPQSEIRAAVESFMQRNLSQYVAEAVKHGYTITFDAERKAILNDALLIPSDTELIPYLSFTKTSEGIEYRFRLGSETESWPISGRPVVPLTNTDPAWLTVGGSLFKVSGINGNMVKPFRQKDVVYIPADKIQVYFKQFIAKNAGRTRIEADGFEMRETNALLETRIEAVENIFESGWVLKVTFRYEGVEFSPGENRDRVTTVHFSEDKNEVSVRRVNRDHARESSALQWLTDRGLRPEHRAFTSGEGRLEDLVSWLAAHRADMAEAGFTLVTPQWEGHDIALIQPEMTVHCHAEGDWFDVRGQFEAEGQIITFGALAPFLRKGEPFFPLRDGRVFLIPETWFSRYADIAKAATEKNGDVMQLPKTLFMLVRELTETAPTETVAPPVEIEDVEFAPSPLLKAELRPYQIAGARWLAGHYHQRFGACLADDMGLGKTLQTLAALLYAKERKSAAAATGNGTAAQLDLFAAQAAHLAPLNALVILPASLVFNWRREIDRFAPSLFTRIHTGPRRERDIRVLAHHDVVLTTYQTARQDLELLSKIEWHYIVLDESQQIKNRDSEVSKVVRSLRATHRISLSGTPVENSLADLWTQMEFINPATLGSFKSFKEQFLNPIERQKDPVATQKLLQRIEPFFLRRTKEEVTPELPALTEQVFLSEMTPDQRKRYDSTKSAVRNEIMRLFDDPKTRLQAITELLRLRQLACHPALYDREWSGGSGKTDDVLAHWETISRAGHKVLFFSSFEQHLQVFRREFEARKTPFAWLTGDVAQAARAREVERFQSDPQVQAFFCTLKAGGTGLNLTAADYVFMLDPWWNPAAENQAVARAHRIGQERPVTAIRFISRDTVEEKILLLQDKKRQLGRSFFADGAETPALTREDIDLLLD